MKEPPSQSPLYRPQADVSWRVAQVSADGRVLPTRMEGSGYERLRNRADKWCLAPGSYRLFFYDNNLVSARNGSKGWDGGALGITDSAGCLLQGGGVSMTDANAGAGVFSAEAELSVVPDGACKRLAPETLPESVALLAQVDVAAVTDARGDAGVCAFDFEAIKLCQLRPKSADAEVTSILSGFTAVKPACAAICASSVCDPVAFSISGPVPVDYGCCDQARWVVGSRRIGSLLW